MHNRIERLLCVAAVIAATPAFSASVRDFTRPSDSGTTVNEAQASELTLTLTEAAMRPIQTWVRTAGTVDGSGRILTAALRAAEGGLVQEGQRLRAFSVNSRTRMHLGRVSRVTKQNGSVSVEATLPVQVPNDARYLMEIVVERGPYLSIPNVSIIEEGDQHIVYIQKAPGTYVPQAIKTGLQGELYTQVLEGLSEGDSVVSVGSFFINAETKLKSGGMPAMPGMDHSQMPGMAALDHTQVAAAASSAKGTTPPSGATSLVMTDPGANARVTAPLQMIHVMFNRPVDPKVSAIEVTTSDGKAVDVGEAMTMGSDGTMLMTLAKAPLPAGTYRVRWYTVGASGQRLEGEFSFTVQ